VKEQKAIRQFINDNMPNKVSGKPGKAALMYLCGHPGTGKTSTLNYVLSGYVSGDVKATLINQLEVHMYNAMTFSDVKSFCMQLLDDLSFKHTGQRYAEAYHRGLKKKDIDDDEMANLVAKMLCLTPNATKIIVIDEIDAFESFENAFRTLTKSILGSKTSTLIIGIANSVDLPFKKKHSAIAMRDTQLLFEPYCEEQIITIIEEKINMRFSNFPLKIKQS
jgi:Cdc6-like AAA superfamily ATPase